MHINMLQVKQFVRAIENIMAAALKVLVQTVSPDIENTSFVVLLFSLHEACGSIIENLQMSKGIISIICCDAEMCKLNVLMAGERVECLG